MAMKTAGLVVTAALVGALVPTMAAARLGESIGECDARYGKPTQVEAGAAFANSLERTYFKDGFTITVLFIDGRAETISYFHPSALTGDEVTKLLNNNAHGEAWEETPNGSSSVYGSWETAQGATAEYFKPKPWESRTSSQYCLKISSSTLARLVQKNEMERKAEERKKAEAAKLRAEAAKQREEQEQRERLKLLDNL
jgi:hypothetical protein